MRRSRASTWRETGRPEPVNPAREPPGGCRRPDTAPGFRGWDSRVYLWATSSKRVGDRSQAVGTGSAETGTVARRSPARRPCPGTLGRGWERPEDGAHGSLGYWRRRTGPGRTDPPSEHGTARRSRRRRRLRLARHHRRLRRRPLPAACGSPRLSTLNKPAVRRFRSPPDEYEPADPCFRSPSGLARIARPTPAPSLPCRSRTPRSTHLRLATTHLRLATTHLRLA